MTVEVSSKIFSQGRDNKEFYYTYVHYRRLKRLILTRTVTYI